MDEKEEEKDKKIAELERKLADREREIRQLFRRIERLERKNEALSRAAKRQAAPLLAATAVPLRLRHAGPAAQLTPRPLAGRIQVSAICTLPMKLRVRARARS